MSDQNGVRQRQLNEFMQQISQGKLECGFSVFCFFISSLNIYTLFHKYRIYVSVNLYNSITIINDGKCGFCVALLGDI